MVIVKLTDIPEDSGSYKIMGLDSHTILIPDGVSFRLQVKKNYLWEFKDAQELNYNNYHDYKEKICQ